MKKTGVLMKTMCTLAMAVFLFSFTGESAQAADMGVISRPLSDFLDAQGTNASFFPPVPDYQGWGDNPFTTFALVDYAGIADKYLIENCDITVGTTVTGSVRERVLPDGRAEVRVKLHTKNAMGFAQDGKALIDSGWDWAGTPTIFGNKTIDVCGGAEAAVGWAMLDITFTIDEPGADLPDIVAEDIVYNSAYYPVSLQFKAKIFDGPSHLEVHQKVVATDEEGVVWTKEVVDIK